MKDVISLKPNEFVQLIKSLSVKKLTMVVERFVHNYFTILKFQASSFSTLKRVSCNFSQFCERCHIPEAQWIHSSYKKSFRHEKVCPFTICRVSSFLTLTREGKPKNDLLCYLCNLCATRLNCSAFPKFWQLRDLDDVSKLSSEWGTRYITRWVIMAYLDPAFFNIFSSHIFLSNNFF